MLHIPLKGIAQLFVDLIYSGKILNIKGLLVGFSVTSNEYLLVAYAFVKM